MLQYRSTYPNDRSEFIFVVTNDNENPPKYLLRHYSFVAEPLADWTNLAEIKSDLSRRGHTYGTSRVAPLLGTLRLGHCYL